MSKDFEIAFTKIGNPELSNDLIDAISRLKAQHWPYSLESQKKWLREKTATADQHLVGQWGNRAVAYLRIAVRAGTIAGRPLRLAGVGTVVVDPDFRGGGLGTRLMVHASKIIRERETTIGVLYCEPELERFYARCGWKVFPFKIVAGEDGSPWTSYPVCLVLDPSGLADGDIAAFGEPV